MEFLELDPAPGLEVTDQRSAVCGEEPILFDCNSLIRLANNLVKIL